MSTLVIGGTGKVGSLVVADLLKRDEPTKVGTRSPAKLAKMPAGATGVIADTTRPETLPPALEGVDKLVLITANSPNEQEEGLMAVRAAREAKIKHLVYISVHDVEKMLEAPHLKAKAEIQRSVLASGIPYTLIMPNHFYQNDAFVQQPLLEYNVYAEPIGEVGLNRVDIRDIAEAIVTAITTSGHEGQRYPLVGPEAITGTGAAALWSKHLGRTIQYAGNDLDAWAKNTRRFMPEWFISDFVIMYAHLQKHGLKATDGNLAHQQRVLGHPPRKYEDYVAETAKTWAAQAAAR